MTLPASVCWEVRPAGSGAADGNGGGFVAGASGTDYSIAADAAAFSGTNLASTNGTNATPSVTSATHNFVAADVGNIIQITAGTNWTTGFYQIVSVAANAAVLDRACGSAASLSGGTWAEGGALATLSPLAASTGAATSNVVWWRFGAYSSTATITFATGQAVVTNSVMPNRLIGYYQVRGDIKQTSPGVWANNANRPTLTLSTNTGLTGLAFSNGGWIVENIIVNCASLGTSTGISLSGNPSVIRNCKVSAFTSRGVALNTNGQGMYDCEVTGGGAGGVTSAVLMNNANQSVIRCNIHDNTCIGVLTGSSGGGVVLSCLITNNTGATSDGVQDALAGSMAFQVTNNVIYGNGRDGIRKIGRWWGAVEYRNNIIAKNLGTGLNEFDGGGTPALPQWDGNAYWSNTGPPRANFDDTTTNPVNGVAPYTNVLDVILTADPFTNAAGGDFTLNSVAGGGAACRAAGTPGALPGVSQVGKLDIGVFQHADPAAGAALFKAGGMTGGMQRS